MKVNLLSQRHGREENGLDNQKGTSHVIQTNNIIESDNLRNNIVELNETTQTTYVANKKSLNKIEIGLITMSIIFLVIAIIFLGNFILGKKRARVRK